MKGSSPVTATGTWIEKMEKNVKCHYAEWRYTESRGVLLTDNSSLSSPPSFVPFAAEKKVFF